MFIVRQNTARIVTVGPVLDADGVAVTDCVVGDFLISKNGGAPAALNGSATLTHRATGKYSLSLTATDLDTVGTAEILISDTVNNCQNKELQVIEEAVYDVWFAASATGAVLLQATQAGVTIPTVTTLTNAPSDPSGVTTLLSRLSSARAGYLDNLSAGAVALQSSLSALITTVGAAGAGLTATAAAVWTVATRVLTAGTNIVLAKGTGVTGFNDLDAAGVRAAVGLASADLDTQLDALGTSVAALPQDADLASLETNLEAAVDAVAADTIDEIVEGAVTVRQSLRLANAALGGKLSGADTPTIEVRDLADSKDRITATVDEFGNRTAVSRDLT